MQTINIEGLSTPLRGAKHLVLRAPNMRMPDFADFLSGGEPIQRYLLLTGRNGDMSANFWFPWNAVLTLVDGRDWNYALTYLANAPKPLFCLVDDSLTVPEAFLRRIPASVTFVQLAQPTAELATSMALPHYDSVFLAPIDDIGSKFYESALTVLQRVFTKHKDYDMKEVLRELRVAGAGIMWTRIQESDPGGAVYWYEPGSASPKLLLSAKALGKIMKNFGDALMR